MADGKNNQQFQDSRFQRDDAIMMNINHDEKCSSSSSSSSTTSSIGEESTVSNGSSITSSDIADDASSLASSSNSSRALYDFSDIMTQLPIKRGLSSFYKGKSESFTSLSRVRSIEDLAKKPTPYRRNSEASKSIGTGLCRYKSYALPPKAIITKKPTRCSSFSNKRGSFIYSKPSSERDRESK